MTTAPTYGAWNTRKVVSAKYSVSSTSSMPNRRSGLSEPNRRIASAKVMCGISPISWPTVPAHSARMTSSPTVSTSDCSTKLISMSSWVNSGWRSLRKSSSR